VLNILWVDEGTEELPGWEELEMESFEDDRCVWTGELREVE
jgi:hypothetical protein